jgi:hypothetical protein
MAPQFQEPFLPVCAFEAFEYPFIKKSRFKPYLERKKQFNKHPLCRHYYKYPPACS